MKKQQKFNQQNSKLILEELEERRLFSGGIEGLIVSDLDSEAQAIYADLDTSKTQTDSTSNETSASAAEEQAQEIVFVDEGVDNHQQLVDDIRNNADSSRNIEVVVLDRDQDGIEAISEFLQDRDDLDAIHIISHGSDGNIELGNNSLNSETLQDNNLKIGLWANAFAETGDILIYGCNLAESEVGQGLIADLSDLTLADVAASDDLTGAAAAGGDWQLEFKTGSIETSIALDATAQADYEGVFDAYEVSNTNATGAGSLHQAILDANANTGVTDTINFNIGSGPQTIAVDAGGLPVIEDPVILDATTQPGYSGTPLITLDGSATPPSSGINGITLRTNDSTVKGFIVINFADEGIEMDGSTGFGDNNTIQNNWVGIDKDGNPAGNAEHGIMISADASGNQIGGTGPNEGNVVGNNGFSGVIINENSDNNIVEGNIIGLLADGTTPAGNGGHGVLIQLASDNNRIGGTTTNAGNVISGNSTGGIYVDGSTDATHTTAVTNTTIQGNLIGTDVTGTVAVSNSGNNININQGATNTIIGGAATGAGNVIAAATNDGITIWGGGTTGTVVQGNYIGTDATGTLDLGNSNAGVVISGGAANNQIGGTGTGEGNVIAFNNDIGVEVRDFATVDNAILGNSIYSNTLLGIDLGGSGVTTNDVGDSDNGSSNNLQNFPVLTGAETNGSQIDISGSLNSTANSFFRIEFFASTGGPDQTYLGHANVTTDGSGNATINASFSASVSSGALITATATKSEVTFTSFTDTSEFSSTVTAGNGGTAIWAESGSNFPEYSEFDGTSFGAEGTAFPVGQWRIMQGAESPERDEKIVIGVDSSGNIEGMLWDGSSWSQISVGGSSIFGTVSQSYWWGMDVQYESQSGDAVMVWNDGSNIEYATWDGTSWSSVGTISGFGGATPRQLQLATSPNSDEMVLVVSDSSSRDSVFVWDGTSWGSEQVLSTGGDDRTDIFVTYEQQSGHAMVVYGKANVDAYYRSWDGSSWSAEGSVAQAAGTSGDVRWATMASDPNSDRIALGVLTSGGDVWFNVWDGSSWGTSTAATTTSTGTTELAMAVAFESTSGNLLATYGESGSSTVRYMTWSSGSGWSAEQNGPNIGGVPNSMTLSSDPQSDRIMLAVNDDNSDVNYVLWNGSTWGTVTERETNSGETKNQPFLFLWDQQAVNTAPTDLLTTAAANGGLSLNQDGGNDAYLLVGDGNAVFGGLTATTMEIQFSSTTLPVDGGDADFVTYGAATQSSNNIWFGTWRNDAGAGHQLGIGVDGAYRYATGFDADTLFDGGAHTVSVTWDNLSGDYEFFVDGASVGSGTGFKSGHSVPGGGALVVGMEQDSIGGGFQSDQVLQATVYDVRIFDDARSGAEIAAGHGQTLAPSESGMLANWVFDNLSTDGTVVDTVGGNNLTAMHASGAGFTPSYPTLSLTISENDANGTVVGNLGATDPDSGDTFTYTLTDDAGGRFDIDSNGQITLVDTSLVDYESASSHDVTVRVTDSGGLTYDEVFTIAIVDVNDAPVLDTSGALTFTTITEDQVDNAGQTVASIIASAGGDRVTDADGDPEGIAVVFTGGSNGTWEYSLDGGSNWNTVGSVSTGNALLLRDTDLLRFNPDGTDGTTAVISFNAWDQSSGTAGNKVDATTGGGSTPFSVSWDNALLTVTAVNDAPVAVADSFVVNEDTPTNLDLLANDTDPENDTLTLLGFERVVASYDAGTSGSAVDPASVAGGSWFFEDTEDANAATGNLQSSGLSPDGASGQNAWNLVDGSDTFGENLWYSTTLSPADEALAGTNGWSLSAEIRLVDDYDDTRTTFIRYGDGSNRFLAYFDLDSNNDLTVELIDDGGNQLITLTNDGSGSADYHHYEIVYDPGTSTAMFLFDGVRVDGGGWSGEASTNEGVRWGMGSGGGQASANYHSIEMKVFDQSITTANGATVTNNGDGTVNYAPTTNYTGADNFTYTMRDSEGHIQSANVDVYVVGVADGIRVTPLSLVPIGGETLVNTTTANAQTISAGVPQAMATDASGNYIVVWHSDLQDGSDRGVYAQLYYADGSTNGGEFLVNSMTTDAQISPSVAMDAVGNFTVTWMSNLQDGDSYGVYAQQFNAVGVAQGSEFLVNTTTTSYQGSPGIAMSASGAFVINWASSGQDPDGSIGIYAQLFDAAGNTVGNEFRANTYTTGHQQVSSVSMDAAGNFVMTWGSQGQDGSNYGVFGQVFNADGTPRGSEFQANTTTQYSQLYNDVAMLPDGRFVVAYQSANADTSTDLFIQAFNADGSKHGGEIRVNAVSDMDYFPIPSITADASGNFTVVWNNSNDGALSGVFMKSYDWDGNALTGEVQVNTTTAGNQFYPEIVAQPDGGLIVAWSGNGAGDADGIFTQRYGLATDETGSTATFQLVLESVPTADVVIPISVSDGTEGSVSTNSITFTVGDWNVPQIVTVTGLQDFSPDGDQAFTVDIGPATSTDPNFNGLDPANLSIVNLANNAPQMTAWFNDAWDTRKELTVGSAQVAGDVTNFPVLITLNADAELAAQALANGDDIVFTAADGVTQLAHEIEFFDETTGELRVWVKTDLSGSVDTDIYMYFGNSASGPQENVAGVWDNYVGVYHLSESPDGTPGEIVDSSGSGNHATTEGSMDVADSVSTTIGQGLAFDGTDDMIRIPDSASLDGISEEATFSLWINFVDSADGDTQIVMSSEDRYTTGATDGYEWASQNDGDHFFYPDAGTPDVNYNLGANPFTNGDWHHLAATMDFAAQEVKIYVDGTPMVFSYEGVPGNWTTTTTSNGDLLWGGNPDRIERFFLGMMDEIRIADVARSQEWLQTEYNNQKTPGTFFSVGTSEDREDKLTDINEDNFNSAGDSVLSIITSSGADRITDDDTGAVEGIAVSSADNTNGQWQYDANADGTWLAFGSVSDTSAVLLDTGALIRFVPNADYNGSAGDLTFHAWDQTSGANGDIGVDVSTNGGNTAYSSETFDATLDVIPVNDAPVLGAIGNQSVDELATLSFTAAATDIDLPADTLTFSLDAASLAAGMTIDANTGAFAWIPTEGQGGSTPSVTITVTDNGNGNLVDSETFTITVNDVNTPPVLGAIGNQSVDELATLSFTATATDVDLPADTLTFSLDAASLAAGMTIDANTGAFSWTPTEGQGGSTPSVTITVTDNGTGNLVDSETFTITVNDVNTPPVLGAIGNQTVDELATLSFTATATDSDLPGDTLTFSLDAASLAAGMTIDANTGAFAWIPTEGQGGSTPSVTITVTDNGNGNLVDSETFTITVNDVNTPPVLGAIGNQSVDELATLSFTATATDVDLPADTLTFSLDAASLAAGMTIDANTGAFSWTPTEGQGGSTPSVTITVTDNGTGNLVDSETFTITVNDVNTPPVLGAIGNQTVDELATLSFTATATDSDLPGDTLTFSLDAASLAAGMTIDANTGAFAWTPTEGQGGSTPSVTITVTDNGTGNLVDSETFTITVNDVNMPPVLGAIGNQTVDELATLNFTATATDADLPADTLTFSLDAASLAAGMTIDANTGAFAWTPTEGQGGSTPSVTITVTDNGSGNLVDSETFTITVNDVNTPPVLGAIGNQSVDELATLSFTATATDADLPADTLTFSLDAASLAAGMTIDANTGAFSWTPTEGQGGSTPSVTITVTDNGNGNLVDSETFTITVNDVNTAPVLGAIGNQSINELAKLSFTATATDSDLPADTLTFSLDAASLAAGMTIDANTGAFSWTPTEGQGGSTPSVTITVTDNGTGNLVDSETFTITVNDVNTPPVLGAIGNQSVDELATLSFTATATDADLPADTLTFSLDAASITAGMTIDANTGVFSWTPAEGQGGSTPSVTITVTDNGSGNLVDSETFTVTVNDVNTPPVLGAIGNQSVDELATLSFTATATDADLPADTLTFSLDAASLAAGMTIDANTGAFSWTPTEGQGGSTPSVTITVTDNGNGNLVDSETFTITVNDVNTAPVLGAIGNQSINELATLSFTATATDSDLPADTLTFSLDAASLAAGMTIDANTGAFSWTPTEGQGGSTPSVTITVTDNGTGNLVDSETFTITVNDVNTPPVLGAIGNQSVDELATLSFTATATDADLPADTLTFSLDAASITAGMTIDANTGVFSWTPAEGQGGSTPSVTITVTDNGSGNLVDSETFTVTVNDVNTPPVLGAIGNQSIDELATLSFTATATDSDLPADTLTFSLDAASLAAGMTIDANTGAFSWTPAEGQGGSAPSVTITVTDSGTGNLVGSETFTITVNDVNTAPVLGSIGNQSVDELATLSFTATATDADLPADTLTFSLDAASLAAGMTIDANTGEFSWTPTEGQGGSTPSVTITVTDNGTGNLVDSETFTVTVNDINTAPVLGAIGNQSINELATLSFTATATDADLPADTLTFSLDAASLAAGMTIDANTGAFSWTPAEGQGGSVPSVTITVTDSGTGNLVDSETFTVTVNDVNTAPVLGAIGNQTVDELATLSFTATATDADLPADTLTFSLDAASLAAGMTIDANTGVFSWMPAEGQGGSIPSVTITVTDNGSGNLVDSETFTITVNDVNTPPVLGAIGNQSVDELATLSFTATATDSDLPADTLTFSLDAASLAAGMTIDANTGAFAWTPTEGQGGSTSSVTITVTDSGTGNLIDSETFTITVNDVNTAPVLGAIGNQSVDELATLSFTATATDSDLPADTLTFSLDAASLAAGMTIDANTGAFAWTPTEGQGGSTPSVTITVTDNGTGNLVDSETFIITVNDVNTPPVLGAIGNQSVDELATLSFTATATDADLPADTLTFSLDAASLAAGMTIDANTGVFSWMPAEGQGGSIPSVTITVTDNGSGNLVDSETFTITVNDVNTPPVLGAIGNQSVDELATLSFTATATDSDLPADTLTFSLDAASLAAGMTIDANTGAFAWTPTEGQGGSTSSVTITVTDSGTGNLIDSETFTITVNDVNTAPVLGAIGNQSVDELATLSFTATATDSDLPADTLTFSLDAASLAAGMTIDANTGAFAWTPTEGQGGSTPSVTITVTDNGTGNLVDSETFIITVNDVNTPPVLGAIGNQSVDELATLSFTATATDADLPADTLTFSLDAASLAAGMTIDANTGVFSWMPAEGQGGSIPSVTITVTDNGSGNLVDSETFTITVNDVNTPPVLGAIGNQSINELATLTFTATATGTDLPADTLTFSLGAASLAAGMTIDANTGVFSWTPTEGQGGSTPSVTITVTDSGSGNLVDSETFIITVNDVNTPPVLGAIGNQSVDELATLTFTATATDADLPADTLTFSLDAASLAVGMTIDANTGAFAWTPTEGQGGSVPSVTITVTDNGTGNLIDSETFTVTVNDVNTAPVLGAIGNQSIDELATLSFTATATDADLPADTLTFSLDAASLAAGMTIDANTGAFSWTPAEGQGGSTPSVTITVTDSGTGNLVDSETFTVTVNDVNTSPVLGAIGNQSVDELATLSFTATATDADLPADTLTFSLDAASLAAGMTIDANTGEFSWTPTEGQGGSTPSVTITVTDNGTGNLVDSETFTVTVNDINTAPVLGAIGNQSVDELATLSFTATATDADLPADTLTFSLDAASLAAGMTIDANTGAFAWTPAEGQGGSVPSVTITVTDSGTGNLVDSETFTVTVNDVNTAPVLGVIGNQSVDELATLSFTATATDADLPADTLTFSLDAASLAAGMTIDANTGAFAWTPTEGQGGLTPTVTITVTDNGTGNLVDSETFTITVNDVNSVPIIGGTDTGVVTEDRVDSTGKLTVAGALTIADADIGESSFVDQTIQGVFGNLMIDASGNWSYSADNGNPEIQALQSGDSFTETLTVTSMDGTTHDVVITINGTTEAPPTPPPPEEPPPEDEPPVDESPDEVEEEQGGAGEDPILEEITAIPQGTSPPVPEEDSSFAQADEPESEPVNYGPVIDKEAPRMPEQPQPQALQAQNLNIDTLTLQVSDDEALNEEYELELLGRIDSMHLGMDDEAAQQNADDVNVQIFVGSTASLTVGIVSWVLRGGALLASFMSTVPLLNRFDPLPILKAREDEEDVEPDEDDDEKTQVREHARKVDNMFSGKGDSQQ